MTRKKIIVLGSGMVGSAIAIDLSKKYDVTVSDLSESALQKAKSKKPALHALRLDISDKQALSQAVQPFDIVVCAVPGFLGYETLKQVIQARKDVVDISFFPENALELDALARQNEVTAIVDCGVAPGLDNMVLGYWNTRMKVESFECLVGGLPKAKK